MTRYRFTFDYCERGIRTCIIPDMEVDLEINARICAGQIDAGITNVFVPESDESMLDGSPVTIGIALKAKELALDEIKRGGRLFDDIKKREGFELRIPDPSEDGYYVRAA